MSRPREILARQIRLLLDLQSCSLSYEWICKLLITDCSLRSMPRIDSSVIVQIEEFLPNRMNKRVEVSSWKISPAYRLVEESITSQNISVAIQADTPGRMARSVENPDRLVPQFQRVAVFEVAVNPWRWRNLESHELAYAQLHRLQHWQIIWMDQEWSLGRLTDSVDAQHMIKVGMSRDNTRWHGVDIFGEPQDSLWLIARIDNHCFCPGLNDVAVGLQPADYNRMYFRCQRSESVDRVVTNKSYNIIAHSITFRCL